MFFLILQADVVAKTRITYPEKELLQLVYNHLLSKGLDETAKHLLKEAKLPSSKSALSSPIAGSQKVGLNVFSIIIVNISVMVIITNK